jgi:hypothetical protein
MISNWLQRADPGFYWVVTYIFSWIFVILWSPLMILLAIPFYGLERFPEFLQQTRWSYVWLAQQWSKRK